MSISKSMSVLDTLGIDRRSGNVVFGQPDNDSDGETRVTIPFEKWEMFGSPEQLTITIQAGDLLNGEAEVEQPSENAEDVGGDDDPAEVLGIGKPASSGGPYNDQGIPL